jgi:hypothetical protein
MTIDRVHPLKFETSADGTQTDIFPTETNPTEDYIAAKGISFENTETKTIDTDVSGNIRFKDLIETSAITVRQLRTAANNIFNNVGNGFIATDVQHAIEEARNYAIITSYTLESLTPFTTSNRTSYVVVPDMSITPAAGTYIALYSASIFYTTTPKAHYWSIFIDSIEDVHSTRTQDTSHSSQNMSDVTHTIVVVNGNETVDVRVKCDNTGSLTVNARNLLLLKIG